MKKNTHPKYYPKAKVKCICGAKFEVGSVLESIDRVFIECNNYRNNWFIVIVFNYNGQEIRVQLPPLRKSEYRSPLIASCK